MERILITGANGQLGSELALALATEFGPAQVLCSDIAAAGVNADLPYQRLDVLDGRALDELVRRERITQIYHLAAMLSAAGERNPLAAWRLNIDSLLNVLQSARATAVRGVFWPSSIAVFGPGTPRQSAPQVTVMDPSTVYGISKLAGERWCHYFHRQHGVDVRSLRYPGLVSYRAPPGGGTTDYAVEIFRHALREGRYTCFIAPDTTLPMMYMDDAVRATLELMRAPAAAVSVRDAYNVAALSFTPAQLAAAIRQRRPDFTVQYQPDYRQAIAASWPASIDDRVARRDWNWQPRFDLQSLVDAMLTHMAGASSK